MPGLLAPPLFGEARWNAGEYSVALRQRDVSVEQYDLTTRDTAKLCSSHLEGFVRRRQIRKLN